MNALSNLKVSHKLIFLMLGLSISFVLLGAAYFVHLQVANDITELEEDFSKYEREVLESDILQVSLRELDAKFFSERDSSMLEQHNSLHAELDSHLADINKSETTQAVRLTYEKVLDLLAEYDAGFIKASGSLQQLGLDQDSGSRFTMRDQAHYIENSLRAAANYSLLASHLQMRRHEKDYLARFDVDYIHKLQREQEQFLQQLAASKLPAEDKKELHQRTQAYVEAFIVTTEAVSLVNVERVHLFSVSQQMDVAFHELLAAVRQHVEKEKVSLLNQGNIISGVFIGILFLIAIGTAVGMYLIYSGIVYPLVHMQQVIQNVNDGHIDARVHLTSYDELGDLARAFDNLLDDRIQTLSRQAQENDQLNNSIIDLIRALGAIAQKDLTIKVPVSEDITGTVADAVNLLTDETSKTLQKVKDISGQVEALSKSLSDQSQSVIRVAENERTQVIETGKALEFSAQTMSNIANEAESASSLAKAAIDDTLSAQDTVDKTVQGINSMRETISETEKRIKRLGERSQEITGIVNLINSIAERTHILALNASMHAASAGEAGKGFAVVAEEVQRLAENAREATSDIALMVNNIRVETSDTVTTMNKLISEVAEGSQLAEQAGQQMKATERSTEKLVDSVLKISENSSKQARISNALRDRAGVIRRYTEQTGSQLTQQQEYTDNLLEFSRVLVDRVSVFSLPEQGSNAMEAIAKQA